MKILFIFVAYIKNMNVEYPFKDLTSIDIVSDILLELISVI
jgi:hypothetical protein